MKKQAHKRTGSPNLANGLKALALLCDRLPSAETAAERSVWHFVYAYDTGDSIPLPGLPPAPGPWSSLATFEAYVKTACKTDLATNPTWRRLMTPENITARREQRRQVNEAIDLVFGTTKEGANYGDPTSRIRTTD